MTDIIKKLEEERELVRNRESEISRLIQKEKHKEKIRRDQEKMNLKTPDYKELLYLKKELVKVRAMYIYAEYKLGNLSKTEISKKAGISLSRVSQLIGKEERREEKEAWIKEREGINYD